MKKILVSWAALGLMGIFACIPVLIYGYFTFKINCRDYLKLAADAPTVERASVFLGKAVEYIEKHDLTEGNSSWIIESPKNDVGIWYQQIKSAQDVLLTVTEKMGDTSSMAQIERDNSLMKLREVLLDVGENGTIVTKPDNISIFPHQKTILWVTLIGFLLQAGWLGLFKEE